MPSTLERSYSDLLGLYGAALEYTLKVNKTLAAGVQRAVQEQIAFADATLAKLTPVTSIKQPADAVAAQSALVKDLQEQVATTTRKLFEIQTETGNQLKQLATEGAEKFSPAALGKLFRQAA
jgi:hypothetical protein